MPVNLNSRTYFRTAEVCRSVGISKSTLFRWLKDGTLADAATLDRHGWRLFTAAEVETLRAEVHKTAPNSNGGIRPPGDGTRAI
ncbi:MAG: MerR family transcriptional regulator [Chloroflexota bacterium]